MVVVNIAILDDATEKIILQFDLSATTIAFHRYVIAVLPLPYTKIHPLLLESLTFSIA